MMTIQLLIAKRFSVVWKENNIKPLRTQVSNQLIESIILENQKLLRDVSMKKIRP